MGEFALIFQILGGLLAIFFIFLTVMNTKTWRWLHVTALFLVFAATVALMPIAAMSLATRFNWVKAHAELTKRVEEQEEAYRDLVYGDPAAPDGGKNALMELRNKYSMFVVDRGRVLRQCTPTLNPADGTVVVQVAAPAAAPGPPGGAAPPDGAVPPPGAVPPAGGEAPPGGAAPAAPRVAKNGFQAKEVVFAFVERPDPTNTWLVPVYYVGQFEVTAATDESLTVRRTLPAGPVVPGEVQGLTWTICEIIPPDMHEVFDFPPGQERADALAKLFPPANAGVPEDVYNRMLAGYLRDGQPAEDTDPPENVWIKVQFQRDYSVVVDSEVAISPINSEIYDPRGQTQVPRLQRGEPVPFKKSDTALFDFETANMLISDGIATLGEGQARIFRRQLNNYENAFATVSRRLRENAAEQARVERHLAEILTANEKALEQIKLQEAEKAMLEADVAKVEHERDELGKYQVALQNKLIETRSASSRLYRSNLKLGEELKATSGRLTEEIDRRTREATASSP